MTREEHIYQLKQYLQGKSISMCPASSLYWQEHWEEVIKALEQEPTTKNDLGVDCIDRKKLIDWINIWDITPIIKKPLIRHIRGMKNDKSCIK